MLVGDITSDNDKGLITIQPDESLEVAAKTLSSNIVGALPVCNQSGDLVGIISERDIVQGFAKHGDSINNSTVADLMTQNVITCKKQDSLPELMSAMRENNIRHLPVFDDGRLSTIISSRDVINAMLELTIAQRNNFADAYEMVR